jgi:hypothetical protein
MAASPNPPDASAIPIEGMTRREAIQRAAILLGLAISPSIVAGVLHAQAVPAGAARRPRYLMPGEFATAAAAAERILPRTDTPGAADVGVPEFIDLMYGEYLTWEEKQWLVGALHDIDGTSQLAHGQAFAAIEGRHQDRILREAFDDPRDAEQSSFLLLKELVVVGYFTAEPVGTKVLHYDPIPGVYQGCVAIADVGNVAWTR